MSHHEHIPPEIDWAVRTFLRRHKRVLRWVCLATAVLALVLVMGGAWAVFRGAARITTWVAGKAPAIIPLPWEKTLGESALRQLQKQTRFSSDVQVLEPLKQLAAPLQMCLTNGNERFTLFVAESQEVNALALPGGIIVFYRGLLERAKTPEEIQGVLAHEMGHITKRHGVLQLAQSMGLELAVQQFIGNENAYLAALVDNSAKLLGLKFSRDHERVADDVGWELLLRANINPQGMVNFFSTLKTEWDAQKGGISAPGAALLSTHPTPQERITRLQTKQAGLGGMEFKSNGTAFKALQNGLGVKLERP